MKTDLEQAVFTQREAATFLRISRRSLCREIRAGKIVPTRRFRTITHEECMRYLADEMPRKRRRAPALPES